MPLKESSWSSTTPETLVLTAGQELAIREYSWFICWHPDTTKEHQERDEWILKWGQQLEQLNVPKYLIDEAITNRQQETSKVLAQIISRTASIMPQSRTSDS